MKIIKYQQLFDEFSRVLSKLSFEEEQKKICAKIFTDNTLDGVNSHGINRFPVFVEDVKMGLVLPNALAERKEQFNSLEIWNGKRGPGMFNAFNGMQRATELAKQNGIGSVFLYNNNHWMRGGTYGWQAVDEGCIGICFTNSTAGMPPWGGRERRLGNNPLVIAVPKKEGAVVLDIALSQFSYGKIQEYQWKEEELPYFGGYDDDNRPTKKPEVIIKSKKAMPIGLWKGSGLSMILDILLTAITGGLSTSKITKEKGESGVSQCLIAIYKKEYHSLLIDEILKYVKSATPVKEGGEILFPGERTLKTREKNRKEGIPVEDIAWERLVAL